MAFFKALTLFIVCILIFGVIISKSKTVVNKNNSTNWNVLITGRAKCPSCRNYGYKSDNSRLGIYLEQETLVEHIFRNCNETFYINKYLDKPNKEAYKAGFYFFCGASYMGKKVVNKSPRIVENISGTWVYDFGFIDLIEIKVKKIIQEEIVLENKIFE